MRSRSLGVAAFNNGASEEASGGDVQPRDVLSAAGKVSAATKSASSVTARNRRMFRLAALMTAASMVLSTTAFAADDTNIQPMGVDVAAVDQQMAAMEGRYASMSAAMATYYAANRGVALNAYLGDNPNALKNLLGSDKVLTDVLARANQAKSPEELNMILSSSGLGLDVNRWTSLTAANADLQAKAASIDAAVVNAGMNWAAALTQIHIPSVQAPGLPAMSTALATSMPAEGLAFGLFMNQSLANLISNFPDVFSQVQASGVGSPTAASAWKAAMGAAAAGSYSDLSKVVGTSSCGAAFVDGLTGKSANGCSPCEIAGMYGNAQMTLIFNPSAGSKAIDPSNPAVSATEWANMTPAQRAAIVAQNPGLAGNVDSALNGTNGCTSAGPAVQEGASSAVKDVLDFLNGR